MCVGGGGDGGIQQLRWSRSGFPAESWPLELRRRGQAFWREREREGETEEARSLSLSLTHTHTPSQQREALFPHKVEKPQEHRKGSSCQPRPPLPFQPPLSVLTAFPPSRPPRSIQPRSCPRVTSHPERPRVMDRSAAKLLILCAHVHPPVPWPSPLRIVPAWPLPGDGRFPGSEVVFRCFRLS